MRTSHSQNTHVSGIVAPHDCTLVTQLVVLTIFTESEKVEIGSQQAQTFSMRISLDFCNDKTDCLRQGRRQLLSHMHTHCSVRTRPGSKSMASKHLRGGHSLSCMIFCRQMIQHVNFNDIWISIYDKLLFIHVPHHDPNLPYTVVAVLPSVSKAFKSTSSSDLFQNLKDLSSQFEMIM